MKTRIHTSPRAPADAGFTLVEVLVVLVILALLATIAIPAFFSQSDKALDASAKNAVRTAATAAEVIATQNGSYAGPGGVTVGNLRAAESTLNAASLTVSGVADSEYTVTVASPTGNAFSLERHSNGTTELTCRWAAAAGCPADGHWGG